MEEDLEWSKRALQHILDEAQDLDKKIAQVIQENPHPEERQALLQIVAEQLGGYEAEEVERLLSKVKK